MPGEPRLSGRLVMADEYLELFLMGRMRRPNLGADFPVQDTLPEWGDLVLHPQTRQHIGYARLVNPWASGADRLGVGTESEPE